MKCRFYHIRYEVQILGMKCRFYHIRYEVQILHEVHIWYEVQILPYLVSSQPSVATRASLTSLPLPEQVYHYQSYHITIQGKDVQSNQATSQSCSWLSEEQQRRPSLPTSTQDTGREAQLRATKELAIPTDKEVASHPYH